MFKEEVASKYLAAIKFSFSADKIIDWQPLFDYNAVKNKSTSEAELHERKHCWKSPEIMKSYPSAEADLDLDRYHPILADFLVDGNLNTKIDGIKGYVKPGIVSEEVDGGERDVTGTRFCGLRFRRRGLWDEVPLGQASASEYTFLLSPHEEILSISVSGAGQFGTRGAVAVRTDSPNEVQEPALKAFQFSTNHGRTTPWIGDLARGKVMAKKAPHGRRLVGLYLAYSGVSYPRL